MTAVDTWDTFLAGITLANSRITLERSIAPATAPSPAELAAEAATTAAVAGRCLLCTNRAARAGDPHQRGLCRNHEDLSLPCGCPAGTQLGMWGDHGAYCRRCSTIVHDPGYDPARDSGLATALGLRRLVVTS